MIKGTTIDVHGYINQKSSFFLDYTLKYFKDRKDILRFTLR